MNDVESGNQVKDVESGKEVKSSDICIHYF